MQIELMTAVRKMDCKDCRRTIVKGEQFTRETYYGHFSHAQYYNRCIKCSVICLSGFVDRMKVLLKEVVKISKAAK